MSLMRAPTTLFDGPIQNGRTRTYAADLVAGGLSMERLDQSPSLALSIRRHKVLHALLIGQLLMIFSGVLNLLLESPFLASIFWLTIGIGLE